MSGGPSIRREADFRAVALFPQDRIARSPERALWCAVLECALRDIDRNRTFNSGKNEQERAIGWIGSRGFREVCLLAGLEPSPVEAALRKALEDGRRFFEVAQSQGRRVDDVRGRAA